MCSVKLKSQINSYSWMIHNRIIIIIIKAIVVLVIVILRYYLANETSGIWSTKRFTRKRKKFVLLFCFSFESSFCLQFGIHPNLNDHCVYTKTCYRRRRKKNILKDRKENVIFLVSQLNYQQWPNKQTKFD